MWKLKKYRGYYAAVGRINGKTKRYSSSTANEELAKQWFDDFKKRWATPNKTIKEIYDGYSEDDKKPEEQRKLKIMWSTLAPHFSAFRPDQIDRDKAKAYAAFRKEQGISDNTIMRELGALRAALRWFDRGLPKTFWMPSKPDPKERYLTHDEFERLLDSAGSPHIRLFIILALATGARTSAILELLWSQVDFKHKFINLGKGTKIKRRGTVPLNDMAIEALEHAFKMKTCPYVIEYNSLPMKSIRKGFDRAVERAELNGVTPHVIRHTAAVWAAEAGTSMSEIAQFLGHSTTAVTERTYARFSPNHLRGMANVLQLNKGKRP